MPSFLNVGTCDLDMGLELSFLSGVADLRPKLKISSSQAFSRVTLRGIDEVRAARIRCKFRLIWIYCIFAVQNKSIFLYIPFESYLG